MAEKVRTIDARTMTDADGNNYYVVFCSRDSDNVLTKPGHAFVVWGEEDSQSHMSSQQSFGFYPEEGNELKAVFSNVPGNLRNEALKIPPAPMSLLTARLIVQVNKDSFVASQAKIQIWKTSDYNLFTKNCIGFAHDVAVALGLFPPAVGTFELPTGYLNELIETTKSE